MSFISWPVIFFIISIFLQLSIPLKIMLVISDQSGTLILPDTILRFDFPDNFILFNVGYCKLFPILIKHLIKENGYKFIINLYCHIFLWTVFIDEA